MGSGRASSQGGICSGTGRCVALCWVPPCSLFWHCARLPRADVWCVWQCQPNSLDTLVVLQSFLCEKFVAYDSRHLKPLCARCQ